MKKSLVLLVALMTAGCGGSGKGKPTADAGGVLAEGGGGPLDLAALPDLGPGADLPRPVDLGSSEVSASDAADAAGDAPVTDAPAADVPAVETSPGDAACSAGLTTCGGVC